jgi:transketolase
MAQSKTQGGATCAARGKGAVRRSGDRAIDLADRRRGAMCQAAPNADAAAPYAVFPVMLKNRQLSCGLRISHRQLPVICIFTHDSIGLGQDGPTHQPVEQLIALRAVPGLITLRPADANEVVEAWRVIGRLKHQPACLVLSRQSLPTFDRTRYASAAGVAQGAYVMADAENGKPAVILTGTGSEVALCAEVYETLKQQGIPARVVSMPSWELFEQQDQAYRDSVLPADVVARVSVEGGSVIGWERYVGATGAKIGMHTFGSSAPTKALLAKFGFTPKKVLAAARDQIAKRQKEMA